MLTCMSQNNEELQRLRGFENICFLQKSEVGPGLIPNFFGGKSSQNISKPVLIFWSSIQHRRTGQHPFGGADRVLPEWMGGGWG